MLQLKSGWGGHVWQVQLLSAERPRSSVPGHSPGDVRCSDCIKFEKRLGSVEVKRRGMRSVDLSENDRVLHNEKVARIIGQRWKALVQQEKKVFQDLAEKDK
eukprot:1158086-Amorphochlora_amoeboformis.AAC.1